MTIGREVAKKFVERATLLELTGKQRDDAAMDFFCGAGVALAAVGKEVDAKKIAAAAQLRISTQGYAGVLKMAAQK